MEVCFQNLLSCFREENIHYISNYAFFLCVFCADIHKNIYCTGISVCMVVKSVGDTGFCAFTMVQLRCSCLWCMAPHHLVIGAGHIMAV